MLRFSLPLLFLLAAGCHPRTVPAPPVAGVAEAQPVAPTGDAALDVFLADLAAEIDLHDWDAVSGRFATGAYAEAVAAGAAAGLSQRDAQARAVALALGLRGLADGSAPRADLDRIQVVTLRTVFAMNDMPGVTTRVEGDVRLDDGTTVPLAIHLGRDADGFTVRLPGSGVDR